jgi:uncharacterized membrane protein HdeD (DUF308 family)
MSSNTPEPQPEKSQLAVYSLVLIAVALSLSILAVYVPTLATLAVVFGLAAVLSGVLSLREL